MKRSKRSPKGSRVSGRMDVVNRVLLEKVVRLLIPWWFLCSLANGVFYYETCPSLHYAVNVHSPYFPSFYYIERETLTNIFSTLHFGLDFSPSLSFFWTNHVFSDASSPREIFWLDIPRSPLRPVCLSVFLLVPTLRIRSPPPLPVLDLRYSTLWQVLTVASGDLAITRSFEVKSWPYSFHAVSS